MTIQLKYKITEAPEQSRTIWINGVVCGNIKYEECTKSFWVSIQPFAGQVAGNTIDFEDMISAELYVNRRLQQQGCVKC